MTACPIRYQRQVSDRKGKIFYTSITSLSHISKKPGCQAARRGRRCGADRRDPDPPAVRSAGLSPIKISEAAPVSRRELPPRR